jgi:hypothetical protein
MVGMEFKSVAAQAEACPGWPAVSFEQAERRHVAKFHPSIPSWPSTICGTRRGPRRGPWRSRKKKKHCIDGRVSATHGRRHGDHALFAPKATIDKL